MCFYVALHGPSLDAFVQYTSCTGVDEAVERGCGISTLLVGFGVGDKL